MLAKKTDPLGKSTLLNFFSFSRGGYVILHCSGSADQPKKKLVVCGWDYWILHSGESRWRNSHKVA